jgi:lysophospholipase L1-like esterase
MPKQFSFHACSGATVEDFFTPYYENHPGISQPTETHPQLDWIDGHTKLITFTVGGNNALFPEVMSYCAVRFLPNSCKDFYGAAVDEAISNLSKPSAQRIHDNLPDLYSAIKEKAPSAHVVVLGYPRLFPIASSKKCNIAAGIAFGPADMDWINRELTKLNAVIHDAALKSGFQFADVSDAFQGHELCTRNPYVNGIMLLDQQQSFHPNRSGQSELAKRLSAYLP